MVTENDLKVGVEFQASKQTNFDFTYKITEIVENKVSFINIKSNEKFRGYAIADILSYINKNIWRLKPNTIYELW